MHESCFTQTGYGGIPGTLGTGGLGGSGGLGGFGGLVPGGFGVGPGASGIGTRGPGQGRETSRETQKLSFKFKQSFIVMFLTTENSILFLSGLGTGVGGFGPDAVGPVGAGRG